MELNDIYDLANILSEAVMQGKLKPDVLEDMIIVAEVPSDILYGIDKEFFRLAHGDTKGFKHTNEVKVTIDDINFRIHKK